MATTENIGGVTFEQICVGKNTWAIGQKGDYSEHPNLQNEKKHKECKESETKRHKVFHVLKMDINEMTQLLEINKRTPLNHGAHRPQDVFLGGEDEVHLFKSNHWSRV